MCCALVGAIKDSVSQNARCNSEKQTNKQTNKDFKSIRLLKNVLLTNYYLNMLETERQSLPLCIFLILPPPDFRKFPTQDIPNS